MGKYEPGQYLYELTKPEPSARFKEQSKLLGELTNETIRRQLLNHLEASITEERAAIKDYRRRAEYAHNFPEIAKLYLHIADEEAHHLQEFSNMFHKVFTRGK